GLKMSITEKLTGLKPNHNWTGEWIWDDNDGKKENTYYYFRREFELNSISDDLNLYITADSRYRLYINGERIGNGSLQSQSHYKYYDIREVSSYLNQGLNTIAVIVNYVGNIPYTRGGFIAELVDEKGKIIIGTDETWKVKKSEAWDSDTRYFRMAQYNPYQEFFDVREHPEGWAENGFDDNNWSFAKTVEDGPWTYLLPRDIPFMTSDPVYPEKVEKTGEVIDIMNRMRSNDLSIKLSMGGKQLEHAKIEGVNNLTGEKGVTVVKNSIKHREQDNFDGIYSPYIIIDFGKIITAFLELELEGVEGGIIDIGYSERLFDGEFNNSVESMFADRYVMKDGKQTFRPFTWKAFRYVKIQFHRCFQDVKIKSVKGVKSTYPYQEKGNFRSDNDKYNKLFDICRYTVRLCSNEFIMDTPWREQGQFLGDVSAVTLGEIYSCFGDTKLPAKYLRQCGEVQHFNGLIPAITNNIWDWDNILIDYNLWWISGIWQHYMYTGEEGWIHQYYPHILKIIQTFMRYLDENGLLNNIPYTVFIDWADVDTRGESSVLNALFYYSLKIVIKMARIKGDTETAVLLEKVREKIKQNFIPQFYNKNKGCFVDANIEGDFSDKISEHANCAPILWDLCDEDMVANIFNKLYEEKTIEYTEAQPFFSAFVLQALYKGGRFDLALEVIDNRWIKRMVDRGAKSTYEEWTLNGSWRNGDHFAEILRTESHAWSAYPCEFFLRKLIGFEIIEPGCKTVKLNPEQTVFDYKVELPVPQGIIKVRKNGSKIDISVPEGVRIIKNSS
ncbi:MAG: family 78 glycoside hydrolase catalytic domain, partial [Halanaerobiaceae bacterium]